MTTLEKEGKIVNVNMNTYLTDKGDVIKRGYKGSKLVWVNKELGKVYRNLFEAYERDSSIFTKDLTSMGRKFYICD